MLSDEQKWELGRIYDSWAKYDYPKIAKLWCKYSTEIFNKRMSDALRVFIHTLLPDQQDELKLFVDCGRDIDIEYNKGIADNRKVKDLVSQLAWKRHSHKDLRDYREVRDEYFAINHVVMTCRTR